MAQRFGRFWLHEKIGQGGMAEIFRATIGPDPETYAFDLAVKRLLPHLQKTPAQVDMFLTEADVAKFLKHPNLIRVYESGLMDGQAFIAMEYVWGLDLGQLLQKLRQRRMRFPTDLAVYVTMQVLRGLDYVHRARAPGGEPMEMVHRDVTPSNVYVTYNGHVKLGDFGVARVKFLETQEEARMLKGKVAYMPPEVVAGHPIDQRVDTWSLAVTLYEMITGRRIYEGVSEADIVSGAAMPRIIPAQKVNPDIDAQLSRILDRALSTKIARRPGDAVDFYQSLKAYLVHQGIQVDADALGRFVRAAAGTATGVAPRTTPTTRTFKSPDYQAPMDLSPTQRLELARRRRYRAVVPVAIVAAFGAALGLGWWLRGKAAPSRAARVAPTAAQPLRR